MTTVPGSTDLVVLNLTVPHEEWVDDALCAQKDPEAFFPEKGGTTRPGKRVCRACPVIDECLTWALDHKDRYGIWGGKSERERRQLINERENGTPA